MLRGSSNIGFQQKNIFENLSLKSLMRNETREEADVVSSVATAPPSTKMTYIQTMCAGAVSRTAAQIVMHPANTYKTLLQVKGAKALPKLTSDTIWRGADAQLLLSLPHGAFYFSVIDIVKKRIQHFMPEKLQFLCDFTSSTISTVICSIVSTPQMVLTDRLMAGVYPSFPAALRSIMASEGPWGFYAGWWPALAQKIPSYGLTWMFFQQMKRAYIDYMGVEPSSEASFIIGAAAAAGSVCVMIPLDTVKTRLVTQITKCPTAYKGMRDCFFRVLREEGLGAFYVSLPPRLVSVVPMIAIQFCIYESLKTNFERVNYDQRLSRVRRRVTSDSAKAINNQAKNEGSGESTADGETSAFTRLSSRRRRGLRIVPVEDGGKANQEDRLRDSKRHSGDNRLMRRVKLSPMRTPQLGLPKTPAIPSIDGSNLMMK
jgi:solute carrier family 25 S-adenosylmethionine transporter 26